LTNATIVIDSNAAVIKVARAAILYLKRSSLLKPQSLNHGPSITLINPPHKPFDNTTLESLQKDASPIRLGVFGATGSVQATTELVVNLIKGVEPLII
jgi:hypothetical protein